MDENMAKSLEKSRKELIKLHKRVIETHLKTRLVHIRTRKKFFTLYDLTIDVNNINKVFFKPIRVFVYALVTEKIHLIQDIYPEDRVQTTKPKKKQKDEH